MSKLSETPSEKLATARQMARRSPPCQPPNFLSSNAGLCSRIAHEAILSVRWSVGPFRKRRLRTRSVGATRRLHDSLSAMHAAGDAAGDSIRTSSELHRELRGCVGYAVPIAPLYRAVAETARAAAFEDSRFLPVTKEEALKLEVSLSVLSPPVPDSSRGSGSRASRLDHLARRSPRPAASPGSRRTWLGPGDFSGADLPQSWSAAGCLAQDARPSRPSPPRSFLTSMPPCPADFFLKFSSCLHPHFRAPHLSTVVFPATGCNLIAGLIFENHVSGAYLLGIVVGRLGEDNMEFAVVIVVLVVAGAMIPGNPEIHFFR